VWPTPAAIRARVGAIAAIVYVPLATAESDQPERYAMALTVVVADTAIAPVYTVPVVDVGTVLSVVYRMAAPAVDVDSVTLCAPEYVPTAGLNAGVDTVPVIVYAAVATAESAHPERYAIAWIVVVEETAIAPEYTVPVVDVGTVLSVVYRMAAPAVDVDSVTLCAPAYVPAAGLNVGVDTVPVIVYVALATAESAQPGRYAIVLIVVVDETAIAPVYTVPVVEVGVEPSVVYRMLAPDVDVESVTLWPLVYVPGNGLNVGSDTVPVIVYVPVATAESAHPARYAIALIVVVADTAIAPVYNVPDVDVGVEPSVVYRMLAPDVDVASVTLCALVYVPAAGLNVGVATVPVIVYAALPTAESDHPARYAIAWIVVVADTAIATEYTVPVVEVGVEPSVVYRMVAPDVDVDSATLWALVYVPAAGLNVGVATAPAVPVVKLQVWLPAIAFPARSSAPVVTVAVYSVE
jgi:hypothetical protein